MKVTLLLTCILFATATYGAKLEIKSLPDEAELYIDSGQEPVKVGVTPFKTDLKELVSSYVKGDSFVIELRKPGHETYRVLLAKATDVDILLTATLPSKLPIDYVKKHDQLINDLFGVQKLIRGKNFGDAISQLEDLEKKHPRLSVIPELRATAFYLNKDIEKSLSYYRKAYTLNPENADAYRMKAYLEKKLGVDSEVK